MKSRRPVLAVWLDALDVDLAFDMANSGEMPNLAGLLRQGGSGEIENLPFGYAEAGNCMVMTGYEPSATGHWAMRDFDPDSYSLAAGNACDLRKTPPFFALDPSLEVITFDLPKAPIVEQVRGIQITNWGCHSAGVPRASSPPELMDELLKRWGEHPAPSGNDHANLEVPASLIDLHARLLKGLRLRSEVTSHLIKDRSWDLFLMCICETHIGGHFLWPHPDCPLAAVTTGGWRMLRDIYREADQTLGRVIEAVGQDVSVVVFSIEGMKPNNEDLPTLVFLPELLARESFPGRTFLDFSARGSLFNTEDWVSAIWHCAREPDRVSRLLRRRLTPAAVVAFEQAKNLPPALFGPWLASTLSYQPVVWYQPYWPHMKAFALPSNTHGWIRLNVRGREKHGIVAPEDYKRVCDEVIAALLDLTDPVSQRPAVTEVIRTRPDFRIEDEGRHLPNADLVVKWDSAVGNCVVSKHHGTLGPVPFHRAGTHTRKGFLCISGPGIPSGAALPTGRPIDIGPTILSLMGVDGAHALPGRPLCLANEGVTENRPNIPMQIMQPLPRLGLVMCIRNEERFLAMNLLYHRILGVDMAFVYLDQCEDLSLEIAQCFEWVRVFVLELDPRPDYVADLHALCMNHALQQARAENLDWLLALDPDEFAFGGSWADDGTTGDTLSYRGHLPRMLSVIPGEVDMVRLATKELIPDDRSGVTRFWEQGMFQDEKARIEREILHPISGERVHWKKFLGHSEGKSIVRVKSEVQAYDSHRWVMKQGPHYPERPDYVPLATVDRGFHLHYLITGASHWREKYLKFSEVPAVWPCGTPVEFPKQCWKEAAQVLNEAGAEAYYRRWVGMTPERLGDLEQLGSITRCNFLQAVLAESGLLGQDGALTFPDPASGRRETQPVVLSLQDLTDTGVIPKSHRLLEPGKLSRQLLRGFYPVEQVSGRLFRWTMPHASIRLLAPPADYWVELHMEPLSGLFLGLESVTLSGNSLNQADIRRLSYGAGFKLPESAFSGTEEHWLEFQFRPIDTTDWVGETRQLGAPLFHCELLPIGMDDPLETRVNFGNPAN